MLFSAMAAFLAKPGPLALGFPIFRWLARLFILFGWFFQ